MASRKVGGIAYFKINGIQYALRGNLKYSAGKAERETVVGQDGVHGFKQMPKPPFIEGDITDFGDVSTETLNNMTDETVTVEMNNGKVFVLKGAWVTNQIEVDAAEGQFNIRFEGTDGKEITSNG